MPILDGVIGKMDLREFHPTYALPGTVVKRILPISIHSGAVTHCICQRLLTNTTILALEKTQNFKIDLSLAFYIAI